MKKPKKPRVHVSPAVGEHETHCCGKSPFDLPTKDKMTLDESLVTCGRKKKGRGR